MKLSKQQFIFVKYNDFDYPADYVSEIHEIAAHFDKDTLESHTAYSLHTEYSYGKRKFDSELISRYPVLQEANKDGIPQLWKSVEWASAFSDFLINLVADKNAPRIIEIHPPFNDYCNIDTFVERFRIFENKIHHVFPDVSIVIENRAGSIYHGGKFLFSKAKEIAVLAEAIRNNNLQLGIVLDFPQLLTAENIDPLKFKTNKYLSAIDTIARHRSFIYGIHIWGKKKSQTGRWVAHCGNLDTYFNGNVETKETFISGIRQICSDGNLRFLVPEVNSGADDLASIMHDLF